MGKEYKIGEYIASYPEYLEGKVCYGKIVDIIESNAIWETRYDIEPDYDKATEAGSCFSVEESDVDDELTIKMNKTNGK
jgi:hypothetical protein